MYRAKPITQRDGSALANSNCRMASIATGLDFDTLGKKTSTGARMRSYTSDQSGGTDSGDAAQAWKNGYGETLLVRDGRTWDDALADLRAGRLVHIDVWHAYANVCVSGTGQYGHTMAIAPESRMDGTWLVSDPWCKPARWAWLSEAKLRAGAEAWGRKIFETAGAEADWPPGAGWPRIEDPDDRRWAILRRIVRALMERYHAGGDEDPVPPPADTGGPQRIMYTTTAAHPEEAPPVTLQYDILEDYAGTVTVRTDAAHKYLDLTTGTLHPIAGGLAKPAYARIKVQKGTILGDTDERRTGYLIGVSAAMLLEVDVTLQPAPAVDCAKAIEARDVEWEDWLLAGAPGSE